MRRTLLRLLPALPLAACTTVPEVAPVACAADTLPDLDPAEDVVEVELRAAALDWDPGTGTPISGLAFGGSVPGPTIEVERGQTLRVQFTNDTPEPTTIHWHGLRVPESMDGVSQMANPVAPGASFTYEFPVQDAGIYWYHPHMDTAIALERGLYGTIVVREPGEQRAVCDLPVVLDDVLLDGSGQIAPSSEMVGAMGRLGNLLLANGQSDRELDVAAGQTVLLRLVNAANARHFALKVPGLSLQVLATDGGWLDAPRVVDALQLGPGERSIIRVDLQGEPGQRLALMSGRVHLHGADAHMQETDPLGDEDQTVLSFVLGDEGRAVASDWQPPQPDVPALAAGDVLHRWVITESGMHEHRIDGEVFPNVPVVEASPLTATTFEIENRSGMRHPFHIHGQRFAVVDDGSGQATGGWKDTWDVPAGAVVRVVSELDNPGTWMYHCHILEHADGGMAGLLQVGEGEPMDGMGAH